MGTLSKLPKNQTAESLSLFQVSDEFPTVNMIDMFLTAFNILEYFKKTVIDSHGCKGKLNELPPLKQQQKNCGPTFFRNQIFQSVDLFLVVLLADIMYEHIHL